MAQFQYRLQPLLDTKIKAKEEADKEVAKHRSALRDAERVLSELQDASQAMESERSGMLIGMLSGEGITGLDVRRRVDDLAIIGRRIEDARDEIFAQRTVVEEYVENVTQAEGVAAELTRQVEVFTRHREKKELKFRQSEELREANEQDEIAATMYEARRRK